MSITTRAGDDGTTRLFSGERVCKDSPRTNACGDIDELVSLLGVARARAERPEVAGHIRFVQGELFVAAAELATSRDQCARLPERIDAARLAELDARRDAVEAAAPAPAGFVVPGGTVAGAHLDLARAVARRCERRVAGLARDGLLDNLALLAWLNRLSDFLWLLARYEEGDAVQPKDAP